MKLKIVISGPTQKAGQKVTIKQLNMKVRQLFYSNRTTPTCRPKHKENHQRHGYYFEIPNKRLHEPGHQQSISKNHAESLIHNFPILQLKLMYMRKLIVKVIFVFVSFQGLNQ